MNVSYLTFRKFFKFPKCVRQSANDKTPPQYQLCFLDKERHTIVEAEKQ